MLHPFALRAAALSILVTSGMALIPVLAAVQSPLAAREIQASAPAHQAGTPAQNVAVVGEDVGPAA
jgi:hypothetical protein